MREDTATVAYTRQRAALTLAGMTIAIHVTDTSAPDELVYVFADHLGSASILADDNGDIIPDSAARYLPFGSYRTAPSQTYTDRGFTGQKHNDDLGLIYYNARYYLPGVGRFLSADTIVPDPTNPQQFNRYSYVLNNPIVLVDPTGHRTCTAEQAATGDETCDQNYPEELPEDQNLAYWQARAKALQYYWANFRYPFDGRQRLTSRFGPGHPTGVDWGGEFTVLAPAPGTVTRAGLDSSAGMWQIQHIESGEIRTWGIGQLHHRHRLFNTDGTPNEDGLLEPERLLATGQWRDIQPGWSHTRGTVINIDHGHNLQTRYHHLAIDNTTIAVGTVVSQGDVLAVTANNGWSTGVHLHYGPLFQYQGREEWLNPLRPTVRSGPFQ